MPKFKLQISMSLDGYIAGPNQGEEHPLGDGARLLDGLGGADIGLGCTRVVEGPGATHLTYRVLT